MENANIKIRIADRACDHTMSVLNASADLEEIASILNDLRTLVDALKGGDGRRHTASTRGDGRLNPFSPTYRGDGGPYVPNVTQGDGRQDWSKRRDERQESVTRGDGKRHAQRPQVTQPRSLRQESIYRGDSRHRAPNTQRQRKQPLDSSKSLGAQTKDHEKKLRSIVGEVQSLEKQKEASEKALAELEQRAGKHTILANLPTPQAKRARRLNLQRLAVSVSSSAASLAYIAVVGAAGAGKSSLINSVRGLKKKDQDAAPVNSFQFQESEKPRSLAVYLAKNIPVIFFEVPGFGSMDCLRWNFFDDQSLYAFDAVILVWESRLTDTDISIIVNCFSLSIPIMIVRTKSDTDLESRLTSAETPRAGDNAHKHEYRATTLQYVQDNLKQNSTSHLSSKVRVFIVNHRSLRNVVKQKAALGTIDMDEREFVTAVNQLPRQVRNQATNQPPSIHSHNPTPVW
eukprot:Gregarina_sp_Pseudo_9__764@NODE_148_length_3952_cov_138_989011_g136_i0_p1_GENE_NODE_148_length_3952_cov_138_989011_g136_i0NODE_148_length_3952_cov_138_989011_g136_i0_p1_ORF_typecomplete_len458_score83_80IIGP/PF05049_13/6_2e38MMR_HSR1/PF01926_23/3_7e03MMR_HSR1/PF01926_23/7e06RsgA_GTPase/PF03193_16/0_0011RsgA_GTPase/PF03193_16/1_3e02FeoB_N/PF02421_18/9_7e05Roc/PF08477_13/0_00086ABC_tran/PF00005_27/1_7e03ABC_tran/PF00005_27/0_0025AIG1/PF04548_16/4e03AIG1/PF04548_16/0_0035Septin/PF00735_18/0_017AAA_